MHIALPHPLLPRHAKEAKIIKAASFTQLLLCDLQWLWGHPEQPSTPSAVDSRGEMLC